MRQPAGADHGLSLAGVPQRRVQLDVEALGRPGVEVGVGAEAAGMDAVDGAEVVDLVDVAGDAERADDLARGVADELAAGFEEQRPVGELGQRCMKAGFSFAFCSTCRDDRLSASAPNALP